MNKILRLKGIVFHSEVRIGKGWEIVEEDQRSASLSLIDLSAVSLVSVARDGEMRVGGFERLKRLKEAGFVLLDARVFLVLWEDKRLIPPQWAEKVGGEPTYIYFDGTIVRSPCRHRDTLCLYKEGGEWKCDHVWLAFDMPVNHVSAVLKMPALAKAS